MSAADRGREPLAPVGEWGFPACAAWCALDQSGPVLMEVTGPAERSFPWASVTKVVTALTAWVAVEEGTVAWSDPAGPDGATLAHLLAHASGLAPDDETVLSPPGRRRIYSNRGFEIAAEHLGRAAGMPFSRYAREAVLDPLGMSATRLDGSAASGAEGPLIDLVSLLKELIQPRLVSSETLTEVTEVAFPGLAGVLPGFGPQDPNDWGLGVELRDHKSPHWTGSANSARTFGHFGRSGSLLWVDPPAGRGLVSLSGRPFGPWAAEAWPALSDAVLAS